MIHYYFRVNNKWKSYNNHHKVSFLKFIYLYCFILVNVQPSLSWLLDFSTLGLSKGLQDFTSLIIEGHLSDSHVYEVVETNISIKVKNACLNLLLHDSEGPGQTIRACLPINSRFLSWGNRITKWKYEKLILKKIKHEWILPIWNSPTAFLIVK